MTPGDDQQLCPGKEPFKNYLSNTSEKVKAKDNKIEEAMKQNVTKSDDERSYAN